MKASTIYFFTVGGKTKGFGHVARLIPLYDEFKSRKIQVQFIVEGDLAIGSLLNDRDFTLSNWIDALNSTVNPSDVFIIDTLEYPTAFVKKLKQLTNRIYFISDAFQKKELPLNVINWRVGVEEKSDDQAGIFGEQYVPLRSQIFKYRNIKSISNYAVLSMGSGDVLNLIPKVLKIYIEHYIEEFRLKVFIQDYHKEFNTLIETHQNKVDFHINAGPDEIFETIAGASFGIASGGHSIYEYAFLGTPVIHVLLVDNQLPATAWNESGFTYPLGWYEEATFPEKLKDGINFFLDLKNKEEAGKIGQRLIDGKGSERIVNAILN